jgi:hypothetical protein
MYLSNKYTKWYNLIVANARLRNAVNQVGFERHHIIPDSFFILRHRNGPAGWQEGNPDHPNNLVILTPREHLICHMLLTRMVTGIARGKMLHALWYMVHLDGGPKKVNSRIYQYLREQRSVIVSEMASLHNPMSNPETKKKHANSMKTRVMVGMTGRAHTDETREKMRIWRATQVMSEETKAKIAATNTGKKQSQETKDKRSLSLLGGKRENNCPHCGKWSMSKWHATKCTGNP